MSRPQRCRRICAEPRFTKFAPAGVKGSDVVCLTTDEYEVLRLVDYERNTHEECAKKMDISRTTVTEIYDSAREKIASVLVNGYRLEISGGNYRICDGSVACCCGSVCRRDREKQSADLSVAAKAKKDGDTLRLALPYDDGRISPHFGHTEHFLLCDIKADELVLKTTVSNNRSGRGVIPELLKNMQVDVLICGGIGSGAVKLLEKSGIQVFSGVSGDTDEAVKAYLNGSLEYDGSLVCPERDKS